MQSYACAVFKHSFLGVAHGAQCPQVGTLRRAAQHLGHFVVNVKAAVKQLVTQSAPVSLLVGDCSTHVAIDATSPAGSTGQIGCSTCCIVETCINKLVNFGQLFLVHLVVWLIGCLVVF